MLAKKNIYSNKNGGIYVMRNEVQKVAKKLSKKFKKREQIIECMIKILSGEMYSNKEIEEIIISFYENNN